MKKNITIKNNIAGPFSNKKRIRKNNSIVSYNLNKIFTNIDKKRDTFHILSKEFKFGFQKNSFKKYKRFKKIVVVGMGGSILGTKAIYCFLQHKIKKDFLFLDNLNENQIRELIYKEKLNNILFIIVSKSGNTIETLTNINLINKIKYRSQYRGTKEMDLFINKFVNSIIEDLDLNQLEQLNNLVNLGDEELIKISNEKIKINEDKIVFLFKEFKKKY